jgi:hypothetical protein
MGACGLVDKRTNVGLSLLLLVAGIFTNHANDIVPPHDFATFAEAFDGCSDFHGIKRWLVLLDKLIFFAGKAGWCGKTRTKISSRGRY